MLTTEIIFPIKGPAFGGKITKTGNVRRRCLRTEERKLQLKFYFGQTVVPVIRRNSLNIIINS